MSNTAQEERPLTEKQLAYGLLRKQGMKPLDIAKAIGIHRDSSYRMEKVVKRKLDLTDDRLVSAAHLTLKRVLKGKPVSKGAPTPKPSDSLRASEAILDRAQPKVTQNLNINVDAIAPIDLDKYRG